GSCLRTVLPPAGERPDPKSSGCSVAPTRIRWDVQFRQRGRHLAAGEFADGPEIGGGEGVLGLGRPIRPQPRPRGPGSLPPPPHPFAATRSKPTAARPASALDVCAAGSYPAPFIDSIAFGSTAPAGREPALYASTASPPSIRANASAIWLRLTFSTHTKRIRF